MKWKHVKDIQMDKDRTAAFLLVELALLMNVTSVDFNVSHMCARGLRIISHAERQPGAPDLPLPADTIAKRQPVYDQLGDPRVIVVGRVSQQKRARKLLRVITDSKEGTAGGILVWTEAYWRWRSLTELITDSAEGLQDDATVRRVHIVGTVQASLSSYLCSQFLTFPQEQKQQWQNLTLFLAAISGVCLLEGVDFSFLPKSMPAGVLPDKLRAVPNPSQLVYTLINDLVRMLTSEDAQIRDTARDALGTELSPTLYNRLLKRIERYMG
jgi:hypothetical protein